ncbi:MULTISPECIES: agmatine/peptidylarginine deiminase [unclassified Lentimonas]|uniref:agmatine deiminase family protein n=1 Tax=unclassified Lentimonas TaxID=2630993 RepID=UPI00132B7874|nr:MULTISPECIES: agmatine deiminase family protein [unclassified Lentimonas]CAA6678463.1 Agmatine deiminase (EC [Lentimonas sp. CC4]CAA6685556.1 Agmatine deiminase (EC [Lentimonas sp. CC6]CAA7077003.1 Agmatine deiminase (EC [Lentimonas sp. CC4]CAA7170554.1 Agmatine deiminase (EC [Lentimonas sp. CC21]CAA7180719.1 Agmatine deiminase (EC [Lentimonas sp. CC8]
MTALSTPKELGYRFPAEWEPQAAVWFAWPTRDDLWTGVLPRVREQLAALYVLAARFQPVSVLCPESAQAELRALMAQAGDASAVTFYDYQTDDVWCRDYGPLFLLSEDRSELCMTDWIYNAWGNKFPLQQKDNNASAWLADHLGLRRFAFDTVLEGGAIESNGAGQLLTTEVVLLNPNRNGEISKNQIEARLSAGLGINEVLWLQDGLEGDDTDGHIDNLARFFKADAILMASVNDPEDRNFAALSENVSRIQAFRTPDGQPYATVQLPLPDPIYLDGERLAASYMNYLVLNGAVLVPTYGQPQRDAEALEILADCYPGREVVGFDCRNIVREGGAIHCMSQHQPAIRC